MIERRVVTGNYEMDLLLTGELNTLTPSKSSSLEDTALGKKGVPCAMLRGRIQGCPRNQHRHANLENL